MDIKILDRKKDLPDINAWLPFAVTEESLPGHTFGVLYDGKIIAIAGLRLVEGQLCFLDSMATDQAAPAEIRNQALDELTTVICKTAKQLGFKYITATTKEPRIMSRAEKHGFTVTKQILLAKEL